MATDLYHGTRSAYTHGGCRCERCTKANRDYVRMHMKNGKSRSQFDGEKLRQLRESRTWTVVQLAKKLRVDHGSISHWELNHWAPRANVVKKLARVFGVAVGDLMKAEVAT